MHSSRICIVCCSGPLSCHAFLPAMHAPTMHTPHHAHFPFCNACLPPCRPPAMLAAPTPHYASPYHACSPAMHTPATHIPCYACPPAMHAPGDRQTPAKKIFFQLMQLLLDSKFAFKIAYSHP